MFLRDTPPLGDTGGACSIASAIIMLYLGCSRACCGVLISERETLREKERRQSTQSENTENMEKTDSGEERRWKKKVKTGEERGWKQEEVLERKPRRQAEKYIGWVCYTANASPLEIIFTLNLGCFYVCVLSSLKDKRTKTGERWRQWKEERKQIDISE